MAESKDAAFSGWAVTVEEVLEHFEVDLSEGLSSEDEMQETETEAGAREQWCVPSNPPPRLVLE